MSSLLAQVISFGIIQIFVKLKSLIVIPILSRLIGTEGYGLLAGLGAFTTLASSTLVLGTNTSLQVFLPKIEAKSEKAAQFWSLTQVASIISIILAIFIVAKPDVVRHLFLPPNMDFFLVRLSGLIILLTILQLLFLAQIIVNQQGKPYSKAMVALTFLDVGMTTLAAWCYGVRGVYLARAVSLIIQLFFVGKIILRQTPFIRLQTRYIPDISRLYHYGFFIYVASLAVWAIDASDRIILGKFIPIKELGIYQVAYSLAGHLYDLAVPIYVVLLPVVSAAISSGKRDEGLKYFLESQRYLILAYGLAVPLISWLGKDILRLLTTPDFVSGARYIPWVASGIACFQIFGIYNYNLHAHQAGQLILISTAIAASVNIGMNLLLVPRYGAIAAAWSTLLAYGVNFVILGIICRKFLQIPLQYSLWAKVAAAIIVMSIFLGISQGISESLVCRLLIGGSLGVTVYVGTLWIIGGLNRHDLYYLGQIVKSFRKEPV